jgi:hypothetical protein
MAKRIMRRFRLDEISGVDRPAQEHAKVKIFKREDQHMPDDTSFLARLAKYRDALLASVKSIVGAADEADKDKLAAQSVDQFIEHVAADVTKALAEGDSADPVEDEMSSELKKALGLPENATAEQVTAAVTKLTGAADKAKDEEIAKLRKDLADATKAATVAAELAKADFSDAERAFYTNLSDDGAKESFRKADHAGRMTQMQKREPELLELAKAVAERDALKRDVAMLKEKEALAEYTKRAVAMGLPESRGRSWMLICKHATTPEEKAAVAEYEKDMTSAIAAAKEGGLYKEFGATGRGEPLTALEELNALAAQMRKSDPKLSHAQAFRKVYEDPENAKLAAEERKQNRPAGVAA